VQGVEFRALPAFHDEERGRQRGKVQIFCFTLDGLRLCHLGDLGELLSPEQVSAIGALDVLLVPVGGHFTIDPQQASRLVESLRPKIVIPMHYKVPKVNFPIRPVEDFLRLQKRVEQVRGSEIEVRPDTLPADTTVYVLHPANG